MMSHRGPGTRLAAALLIASVVCLPAGSFAYVAAGTGVPASDVPSATSAAAMTTGSISPSSGGISMFLLPAFYYEACTSVNGAVTDTDGNQITNLSWAWGDGATTYGDFPMTHNYSEVGSYSLTVTATDSVGATESVTEPILVNDTPWPEPNSTVDLAAASVSGLAITVNGLANVNVCGPVSDPNPGGYLWSWGDGSTSQSFFAAHHTYASPGEYEVCVTVFDSFNVSTQRCEGVLVGISQVPLKVFANESSSSTTTPLLGQPFTEFLAMEDTGSAPATPPATLTVASATALVNQSAQLSCSSQDEFAALVPSTVVSVPYLCRASWSFPTPGTSLAQAFVTYAGEAATVAQDVTTDGAIPYAATVLAGEPLAAFELGWNGSWGGLPGIANASEGVGGLISLAASGAVALGVNYALTLPSDPAYSVSYPAGSVDVSVVADPLPVVESIGWLENASAVGELATGAEAAAISALPACGTLGSCAPAAGLFALGLLGGAVDASVVEGALPTPNLNFTAPVTVAPEPGVLASLSNVTAPLLADEFAIVEDLNAANLAVARAEAALGAHADLYAELQFLAAYSFAENASNATASLLANATTLVPTLNDENTTTFDQGLSLLNTSGIPTDLSTLLSAVGVAPFLNLTEIEASTFASCNTSEVLAGTPDLGGSVAPAIADELAALGNATTVASNGTILAGGAAFDDGTITGVSVSVSSPSTTSGTRVTVTTKQFNEKPRGPGVLPVHAPVGYFDVNVSGVASGSAQVCVATAGIGPTTAITYWTGSLWVTASGGSVGGLRSCASFTIAELHGTILALGIPTTSYLVTLREEGLPQGTAWSAGLGSPASLESNTTGRLGGEIQLNALAGPTALDLRPPVGYGVVRIQGPSSPTPSTLQVAGNATYTVRFGKNVSVNFVEDPIARWDLYDGANWTVTLVSRFPSGGGPGQGATTTTNEISFTVPSGSSWNYSITGPSEYAVHPSHGTFSVAPNGLTKLVRFALETEAVVFVESGLPRGTSWIVTLTGGTSPAVTYPLEYTTASRTLRFLLPVGDYTFAIASVHGPAADPATASVMVTAAPSPRQLVNVDF